MAVEAPDKSLASPLASIRDLWPGTERPVELRPEDSPRGVTPTSQGTDPDDEPE